MFRVTSDHALLLGGNVGDKSLHVTSTTGIAVLSATATGAGKQATLSAVSNDAHAVVSATGGSSLEARLLLRDSTKKGFELARETVRDAASGNVLEQNGLSLYWTSPGPGSTASVGAGGKTVTSSGGHFGGIKVGEYVAITVDGLRVNRQVRSINTGGSKHTLVVGPTAFSSKAITNSVFEHGKRVLSVEVSHANSKVMRIVQQCCYRRRRED